MTSFSMLAFKFFAVIAGLINPLITIFIGVILRRVEDVFYLINPSKEEAIYTPRGQKTINLFKLLGLLMIIYGSFKMVDNILDFLRYIMSFLM